MEYGPNSAQVKALLQLLPGLTWEQWEKADWPGYDREAEAALWSAIEFTGLGTEAERAHTAVHSAARESAERAYCAARPLSSFSGDGGWRKLAEQSEGVKETAWRIARNASRHAGHCLVVRDALSKETVNALTRGFHNAGIDFDAPLPRGPKPKLT